MDSKSKFLLALEDLLSDSRVQRASLISIEQNCRQLRNSSSLEEDNRIIKNIDETTIAALPEDVADKLKLIKEGMHQVVLGDGDLDRLLEITNKTSAPIQQAMKACMNGNER